MLPAKPQNTEEREDDYEYNDHLCPLSLWSMQIEKENVHELIFQTQE